MFTHTHTNKSEPKAEWYNSKLNTKSSWCFSADSAKYYNKLA